jgi:uncharacterized protein (DUF362 family)
MKDFVSIYKFFENTDERSLEALTNVYENYPELLGQIESIINEHLDRLNLNGKKILIKPNWVTHSYKESDEICLRTNDNFLLAVLEVILKKTPSAVLIGDAPIQGCRWDEVVKSTLVERVTKLSREYQISVKIEDFRRTTFSLKKNELKEEIRPNSDYVIIDVKEKSYLEPVTEKAKQRFRVTNYDPEKLVNSHKPGIHKYCITKELFDADVVFSLPKIKTHQKTGITGALKNVVGLNGDKDFLPHHRMGGTGFGGDCYPGKNYLRFWTELMLDKANRNRGKRSYLICKKFASLLWRLSFPKNNHSIEAGWYGNDTTWRMVLDLNLIIMNGKSDGTLTDTRQREIYSICDGIVAGQGDGPLKPEPLPLGVISFTNNSALNDIAMATLMGIDYKKLPLLTAAEKLFSKNESEITMNSAKVTIKDLMKLSLAAHSPRGWKTYLITK